MITNFQPQPPSLSQPTTITDQFQNIFSNKVEQAYLFMMSAILFFSLQIIWLVAEFIQQDRDVPDEVVNT